MVVDQFDIVRVAVTPGEADAPLVIDTDTVLPRALGGQLFQTVTGRYAQIDSAASIATSLRTSFAGAAREIADRLATKKDVPCYGQRTNESSGY